MSCVFTDESRFCLRMPDGREQVYCRSEERFTPCATKLRENFNGGSIMVWPESAEAHTDLHFF